MKLIASIAVVIVAFVGLYLLISGLADNPNDVFYSCLLAFVVPIVAVGYVLLA